MTSYFQCVLKTGKNSMSMKYFDDGSFLYISNNCCACLKSVHVNKNSCTYIISRIEAGNGECVRGTTTRPNCRTQSKEFL